jgi:hypothetical protein
MIETMERSTETVLGYKISGDVTKARRRLDLADELTR